MAHGAEHWPDHQRERDQHHKPIAQRDPQPRPSVPSDLRRAPRAHALSNQRVDQREHAEAKRNGNPRPTATIALRRHFERPEHRHHQAVDELHRRVAEHRNDSRPRLRPNFTDVGAGGKHGRRPSISRVPTNSECCAHNSTICISLSTVSECSGAWRALDMESRPATFDISLRVVAGQ